MDNKSVSADLHTFRAFQLWVEWLNLVFSIQNLDDETDAVKVDSRSRDANLGQQRYVHIFKNFCRLQGFWNGFQAQ